MGAFVLVLRLIPVTKNRSAWLLIAAAVLLMALRRVTTLIQTFLLSEATPLDEFVELITLMISLTLFGGLYRIEPLFLSRDRLIRELEKALSEVKTLHGLIPICAACKKIRDDKGYWTQVETYVREHSSAEFSHSLCPECAAKMYPEFADTIDASTNDPPE